MQLVIIAGGKGTRLGLTDIPKPMVRIGGKPLLEHQILLAKAYGIKEIYILSGHLSEVIIDYFKDGSAWGLNIHHVVEPSPLGTAGAVGLLRHEIQERFMVFYGDVVMDFDLEAFIKFDQLHDGLGTLIVHPNDHPFDSDLLQTDAEYKICAVYPKGERNKGWLRNMVNAAVYIFSPDVFAHIPEDAPSDFGKDIFAIALQKGAPLYAYETAEYIKDMGTTDRFPLVAGDFTEGKVGRWNKKNPRPAVFLDRDGVINEDMDTSPSLEKFSLFTGVPKAIARLNKSDYLAIVTTNQPMISKGFISADTLSLIHKKMETLLGQEGAYLNGIYHCPHHPEKGFEGEIPALKIECDCRKPKPGMLLQAQSDFNIDLNSSWMVGDRDSDISAGKAAGCRTIFIGSDNSRADYTCASLAEAVDYILGVPHDYHADTI